MNNILPLVWPICDDKCDTKDTLYDDCEDTYARMLKILEMSVTHVYMVIPTLLDKNYPLKSPKLVFMWCTALFMQKYNTFIFLQMG